MQYCQRIIMSTSRVSEITPLMCWHTKAGGNSVPFVGIWWVCCHDQMKAQNESTWYCCEPTCLCFLPLFDLDVCGLWPWPMGCISLKCGEWPQGDAYDIHTNATTKQFYTNIHESLVFYACISFKCPERVQGSTNIIGSFFVPPQQGYNVCTTPLGSRLQPLVICSSWQLFHHIPNRIPQGTLFPRTLFTACIHQCIYKALPYFTFQLPPPSREYWTTTFINITRKS